jgi:hypothetical protein
MNSMNASERRAEAPERRLARRRSEAKESAMQTVLAEPWQGQQRRRSPRWPRSPRSASCSTGIAGRRRSPSIWGFNPREVRRWKAGTDASDEQDLRVARMTARRRAKAILLVGPGGN